MESVKCAAKVQHVNKKSSDELLRKFAATEAPKRRRKSRESGADESPNSSLAERRSLLPAPPRKSALLKRLGIRSRAPLKGREIKHKSLLGTIEKTWRRTVEGASKVFMEKHYNRHKLLINDIV